jgi:hypothetical protein
MKWFITKVCLQVCHEVPTDIDSKGTPVKESEPAKFEFYWDKKVAEGRPSIIEMTIYACEDSQDSGPPMYADNGGMFMEDHRTCYR